MFRLKKVNYLARSLVNSQARALTERPSFLDKHEGTEQRHAKERASVLVIGGGCVGTSLAYHLSKYGVKDVVLLEKTELTGGSTWHAAGLTTYYHPGINMRKIHFDSIRLFETIEAETDQEIGFHKTGSIRIAHSQDHWNEFKYMMTRHNWHPADQHLIDPATIADMFPLLNLKGVVGGLYNPGDGHTDPYSLTMAFAKGARKYGATLIQDCPVTATKQLPDGKWQVDTPSGSIVADQVVNAAGFHGRQVGEMAGLDLPLVPIHHQYMVTAQIPLLEEWKKETGREVPGIRDLRGSYYCRQERNGLVFGPYEGVDKMEIQEDWYDNGPPVGFGKELYQSNLDRIEKHVEHMMDFVPILQETDIQSVISGPITYTPDILPMVGPTQHLTNYWLAVGFGYGIIHSGGMGKFLARWMMNGEPDHDLIETDPDRYNGSKGRAAWADRTFLMRKARESYGMNNSPIFPKEERWAGRPTSRVSGAYEATKDRGAAFGFHSGWEVPHWFATEGESRETPICHLRKHWHDAVGREVDMIMNKVGVVDLSSFGKFVLEGPGAAKFLSSMVANTLPKVGRANLSHMLTPAGKVYAELTVTRLATDKFYLVTGSGSEPHDIRWLLHHMPADPSFTLSNLTEDMGVLGVTGPQSRDLLSKLTDTDMSHEAFSFLSCKQMEVAGVQVDATRISYTGELGWELNHAAEDTSHLYKAILEAGQEFGVGDYGSFAMNSLRVEKGFNGWGAEMNLDKNAYEAGLGGFVKVNKKVPFIGQESCRKQKEEAPKSTLVTLKLETWGRVDPEGNETVWFDNVVVGNTTSGAWSYNLDSSICMAYIPTEMANDDHRVYVELMGVRYPAYVSTKPLFETEPVRVSRSN